MFAVSSSPPQAKATPAVFVVRSQFGRLARSEGTAERATPAGKVADATVATEPLPAKPATETSAEIMPAQFQATFYEVRPAEGRAGALDASGLLAKAASADSLLKELADFGTSRILYRIDQPVNLLDDQMEISTNEPVLTAMRIGPAGQPMNTVMYRPSGVIVRLATQAPPNEAHNGGTNVAMMINFSTLTPSESPIGPGQAATVVRSMVFRHSEPLEFGHPRVILNVGPSSSGDRAIPLAYVVRYLFSPAAAK
jgi:hypothetical protein